MGRSRGYAQPERKTPSNGGISQPCTKTQGHGKDMCSSEETDVCPTKGNRGEEKEEKSRQGRTEDLHREGRSSTGRADKPYKSRKEQSSIIIDASQSRS